MKMSWSIGKIFSKWAQRNPEKSALIFQDKPVTYRQMNEGINRFAYCLQSLGLKKGDRIAVDLSNCPEFFEIFGAAAKLGLIFVPLNFRMVPREVEYQLNHSGARLLVFHDLFGKNVDPIRTSVAVEKGKYIVMKSGLPDVPDYSGWASDYHELTKDKPVSEPEMDEPVELSDPLTILYTSGVTGNPKGAVLSHEQTFFKDIQIQRYANMCQDDVFLTQLPLFHSGGLFIVSLPTLDIGGTLIMRPTFDPREFGLDIGKHRPTVVFVLTTMWRMLLQAKAFDGIDLSSVRVVFGGGERTPKSLLDELAAKGLHVQTGFGQTENSAMAMVLRADTERKQGSVGLPGFCTEVWTEGPSGNKLPPGEIGEFVATGPTVMSGYWNDPQRTAETIVNGVLHTGDLGYVDDEGYLYIVDRIKDMYRSGGENVYPAEIEKVLSDHPKIDPGMVSIIGVPDDKWGETGKAFIVCKKGETLTKEEILKYLEGKVAKHKYPSHVVFIDSLPMTTSGKIRKSALREQEGKLL
jgi:fatty-acyl-CoA synthase